MFINILVGLITLPLGILLEDIIWLGISLLAFVAALIDSLKYEEKRYGSDKEEYISWTPREFFEYVERVNK